MAMVKRWTVDIYIDEHPDERRTYAEARLHTGENTHLVGVGTAARNPADTDVPEIGDELAGSRALIDLAARLQTAAADDVKGVSVERGSYGR